MAPRERRITLRFETLKEFEDVKRAAQNNDRSLNWFIANAAVQEARKQLAAVKNAEVEVTA